MVEGNKFATNQSRKQFCNIFIKISSVPVAAEVAMQHEMLLAPTDKQYRTANVPSNVPSSISNAKTRITAVGGMANGKIAHVLAIRSVASHVGMAIRTPLHKAVHQMIVPHPDNDAVHLQIVNNTLYDSSNLIYLNHIVLLYFYFFLRLSIIR